MRASVERYFRWGGWGEFRENMLRLVGAESCLLDFRQTRVFDEVYRGVYTQNVGVLFVAETCVFELMIFVRVSQHTFFGNNIGKLCLF